MLGRLGEALERQRRLRRRRAVPSSAASAMPPTSISDQDQAQAAEQAVDFAQRQGELGGPLAPSGSAGRAGGCHRAGRRGRRRAAVARPVRACVGRRAALRGFRARQDPAAGRDDLLIAADLIWGGRQFAEQAAGPGAALGEPRLVADDGSRAARATAPRLPRSWRRGRLRRLWPPRRRRRHRRGQIAAPLGPTSGPDGEQALQAGRLASVRSEAGRPPGCAAGWRSGHRRAARRGHGDRHRGGGQPA